MSLTPLEQVFQERSAIFEYEGGLSRMEAEERAWIQIYGPVTFHEEMYQERAAILEHDGGLERAKAEVLATRLIANRIEKNG